MRKDVSHLYEEMRHASTAVHTESLMNDRTYNESPQDEHMCTLSLLTM